MSNAQNHILCLLKLLCLLLLVEGIAAPFLLGAWSSALLADPSHYLNPDISDSKRCNYPTSPLRPATSGCGWESQPSRGTDSSPQLSPLGCGRSPILFHGKPMDLTVDLELLGILELWGSQQAQLSDGSWIAFLLGTALILNINLQKSTQ